MARTNSQVDIYSVTPLAVMANFNQVYSVRDGIVHESIIHKIRVSLIREQYCSHLSIILDCTFIKAV